MEAESCCAVTATLLTVAPDTLPWLEAPIPLVILYLKYSSNGANSTYRASSVHHNVYFTDEPLFRLRDVMRPVTMALWL